MYLCSLCFFLSPGICREHIWDVSTLESLVAFMYESYSFPVALALLKLFSKVNEYGTFDPSVSRILESGRDSLAKLNVVECFDCLKDLLNGEELSELQKELYKLQDDKQKQTAKKSDCTLRALLSYYSYRCVHHPQIVVRTENRTGDKDPKQRQAEIVWVFATPRKDSAPNPELRCSKEGFYEHAELRRDRFFCALANDEERRRDGRRYLFVPSIGAGHFSRLGLSRLLDALSSGASQLQ